MTGAWGSEQRRFYEFHYGRVHVPGEPSIDVGEG